MNPPDYRSRSPGYYLEKIDPDILASFKPEQIEAITSILKQAIPKSSPKIVDFRFTIDLIISRFYLVLLVGKDFRKEQRQYKSRGITRVGNIVAAIILLIATNLTISALILLIAYLFKSAIGLDFLPNHFSETLKKILGN